MKDLRSYLNRIGFEGETRPDFTTLRAIHRGHLLNIPYENLDVVLGRQVDLDVDRMYEKMVLRGRGGWCYEMNGLLAWALETVGFEVLRLAGAVERSTEGDSQVGNHLVLLVDGQWFADVGFGDGLHEPVPLVEGTIFQDRFRFDLERVDGDWWRYRDSVGQDFDFRIEAADLALLQRQCDYLRNSPDSIFTQNVVAIRNFGDRVEILRNSIRSTQFPDHTERNVITNVDRFVAELSDVFGIDDPEAEGLWPFARERGEAYLASSDSEVGELG